MKFKVYCAIDSVAPQFFDSEDAANGAAIAIPSGLGMAEAVESRPFADRTKGLDGALREIADRQKFERKLDA